MLLEFQCSFEHVKVGLDHEQDEGYYVSLHCMVGSTDSLFVLSKEFVAVS